MSEKITHKVQPVILCGGSGTRLWPLSRSGFPKQFLCLTGNDSLFQQAAKRFGGSPYIVSNEDHRFLAQEQLREIGVTTATFLLEPVGRSTAPALTLAALAATEHGDDPILLVTPADQTIADEPAFQASLQQAVQAATQGNIVVLGVTPTQPETGYGYIQVDTAALQSTAANPVLRFVEKPNASTAQAYLDEGGYFWNAGMFVLKASVWLKALDSFRPDIANATRLAWQGKQQDGAFLRTNKAQFSAIPSESVDYAVMEKCPGSAHPICMVPLNAGWSDLGAWDAVWAVGAKDEQGNSQHGDVISHGCSNALVHASSRLVALVGVNDLVVFETPDAVLVANKSRSQDVKHIVNTLTQQKRAEHTLQLV